MINNISKYNSYDILFKTSMNAIRQVDGSDTVTQNLFGASVTAQYSNQINTDVMNDINKFVDTFKKTNALLIDSADQLENVFTNFESTAIENNPIEVLNDANEVSSEDLTSLNEVDASTDVEENINTQTVAVADSNADTDGVSNELSEEVDEADTESKDTPSEVPSYSPQTEAASDFVTRLNDTLNFLEDNNRSNRTDLLKRRIEYDFTSQEDQLESIGITRDEDGQFNLSKEAFEAALQDDPDNVRDILNGDDGLATRVSSRIEQASEEPAARYAVNSYDLRSYNRELDRTSPLRGFNQQEFGNQLQIQQISQRGSILNMLL